MRGAIIFYLLQGASAVACFVGAIFGLIHKDYGTAVAFGGFGVLLTVLLIVVIVMTPPPPPEYPDYRLIR